MLFLIFAFVLCHMFWRKGGGVILRLWSHISDVFHCGSVFGGDGMYFLSMVMLLLIESRVV